METGGGEQRGAGWVTVASASVCLIALVGCASAPEPVPTSNPPTATPVFASDEEALAAATEAYTKYLKLSSDVAHDGGTDTDRMAAVSTGEALETETRSLKGMLEAGTVGVGQLSFDTFTIQAADLSSGSLMAYVCLDVSGTDVLDASGASVLSGDRVERLPLEIGFMHDKKSQRLLLERTRIWDGDNFCSPQ